MGVKPAPSYLVAPGFTHCCLAETAKKWAYHEHGATQGSTFFHKVDAVKIIKIQLIGLKSIVVSAVAFHLNAYLLKQTDKVVYIENVGYVANRDRLAGKQ